MSRGRKCITLWHFISHWQGYDFRLIYSCTCITHAIHEQPFRDCVWRGTAYRLFALISLLTRGYKTTNIEVTEEEITSVTKPPSELYTQPFPSVFQFTQPISSVFFLIVRAYLLVGPHNVLVLKMFRKKILYLSVVFSQTYLTSCHYGFLDYNFSDHKVLPTFSVAYVREWGGGREPKFGSS